MNKALVRVLCPVLMLASGLMFAFAFSPASAGSTHIYYGASLHSDLPIQSGNQAGALEQAQTPTPTPEPVSEPGSTDGIMILSVAIAVIILVPLMLQRGLWKE